MAVSFVHTADLHLGKAFTGLKHLPANLFKRLEDSVYRSLERVVTNAINHNVDFVLFVGDIFDEKSGSLKAQIRFNQQLKRLDEHGISSFICHGNHDPVSEQLLSIRYPESVHVFNDEKVTSVPFYKDGKLVSMIYGFSYTNKEVLANQTNQYIKKPEAMYHIGMLHGNAVGYVGHDRYAPFLVSELVEKGFDYWALGHIHKRDVLAEYPPIVYPGNIQGMHIKENGDKGCMLVKISDKNADVTFIPTADIVWKESEISITSMETMSDLLNQMEEMIDQVRMKGIDTFLRIRLTGNGVLHDVLQANEPLNDLLEHLQEGEDEKHPFVWIMDIILETSGDWDRQDLAQQPHFIGELLRTIDGYDGIDKAVKPLTRHRMAKHYISSFTEAEKKEVLSQVETLLLTELTKEKRRWK